MAADTPVSTSTRHRPRSVTVFVAAFVAGAAAAVGVNRALDVHLSQAKPQVECEPIFVALRSLPQGVPVTVWDVALRDWPKAMLPSSALRVTDSFEGCLLKVPLREGQPLLAAQLIKPEPKPAATSEPPAADGEQPIVEEAFVPPTPAAAPVVNTAPAAAPAVEQAAPQMPEPPAQTATTEPEQATEPVAIAVAEESTPPAVVGQPTLAPPATEPAFQQPELAPEQPAAALAAAPPAPSEDAREATRSIDADFDIADMPSRPTAELAQIPSVMSQAGVAVAPPAEETGTGAGVRYLVVPERIARQADTSFTTPVAPEGRPAAEGQTAPPQQRTTTTAQPTARQTQSKQPPVKQPQSKQVQSKQPQAKQPDARQPQRSSMPRGQSHQKPGSSDREEPGPRAWGGMFPNVSAGLEAMGGWRGRVREAAVPQNESARP